MSGDEKKEKEEGLRYEVTCGFCGMLLDALITKKKLFMDTCEACGISSCGGRADDSHDTCPNCGADWTEVGVRRKYMPPGSELPISICPKCVHEELTTRKKNEVDKDVTWKCKECGAEGKIREDSALAKEIRSMLKTAEACGILFKKENCPVCTGRLMPMNPTEEPKDDSKEEDDSSGKK